ncbi:MAG: ABC transporter substrate-binding protein [Pedobacter agri]
MNRPLKVGFLMPYSGIYPYYAQHVMAGIYCAAMKMKLSQQDFAFVPVYVGQGGTKAILEALQKLLFFEGVDVVTGMINIKVLDEVRPLLENHNKLGLFFDMGELVPSPAGYGPNIGLISMDFWQAQYALGQWAVQEFGRDGQIVAPIYEAGFNLNAAFMNGAGAAGAEKLHSMVLPENLASKNGLILDDFFAALEKNTPHFVHAIFIGNMGNQFLQQWRNSRFYDTVPLLIAENMGYDDMLDDVKHLGMKVYSTSIWNRKDETVHNRKFVKDFEDFGKQQANVFGMIGYEIGLSLTIMMSLLKKGEVKNALTDLKNQGVTGPRGILDLDTNGRQRSNIDIIKIITSNHNINQTIIAQTSAVGLDTSSLYHETVSGWQNPYLSV